MAGITSSLVIILAAVLLACIRIGETHALEISGTVILPTRTQVLLDGGFQKTRITSSGSFKITDVSNGSHLLEIISPDFAFDKIRITASGDEYFAAKLDDSADWDKLGTPIPRPITIEPKHRLTFRAKEISVARAAIKSPLVLLSLGSVVVALGLPKLMTMAAAAQRDERERQRQERDATPERHG